MADTPDSMHAIRIIEPGGPEVLEFCDRPVPVPASGELLVRVEAAGVNRADIILRQPDLPIPVSNVPEIPGVEIAGTVAGLGDKVDNFRLHDRVCALVPQAGGYAEYCVAPSSLTWPVPEGYVMPESAALPEALLTVWNALFHDDPLQPGQSVLIHGGTSGIGCMAIQMAAATGARVFATAGTEAKCAAMSSWGAEVAINYREQDFVDEVNGMTQGRGADVILDIVGGSYISRNVDALAAEGRLVQIGMIESPVGPLNVASLMAKRARIVGASIWFQSVEQKAELASRVRERFWPRIERRTICPVVDSCFPLSQAAEAQAKMEASAHIGKIVLLPTV